MSRHATRETLPEGFSYADRLQVEAFMATGSIDGASKVCMVAGPGELPRLATRLRPPRRPGYSTAEYKQGWEDGKNPSPDDILDSSAYAQGYLDRRDGRMKWHFVYCTSHNNSATGCGVA